MKTLFRSLIWIDVSEKDAATANLRETDNRRLLNMKPPQQAVMQAVVDFLMTYAEAPSLGVMVDEFTRRAATDELAILEELPTETPQSSASYLQMFEMEVERQAAENLSNKCRQAVEIATKGISPKAGVTIKGVDDAVAFLYSELKGRPQKADSVMPANMRAASDRIFQVYAQRKSDPRSSYGVMTGYGLIDAATAGIRKKQLYLHAGFGGHLKSTHAMNMTINAAVDGGWNALFFSSEMPAIDVMMILVSIHSANPKFRSISKPLNAARLILGRLNDKEEATFQEIKEDLTKNPQHGSIRVVDTAEFTTFSTIQQRVTREHAIEEVDLVWVDYLTRLPVDAKYMKMQATEAKNEVIADAKRFAMSFDRGAGLAVCTPFQVNREGYKRARDSGGHLDKTALAQYNAAEREADVISYIFFDREEQLSCEPKLGMMKSRWGHMPPDPVNLYIDPDSRRISDLSTGMASIALGAPTSMTQPPDDVIL